MPSVKVKYPKPDAVIRCKDHKQGPLSVDDCKAMIGWTEEPEDKNWAKDFVLKDLFGRKIRLANNPTNRPFKRPLADRYANEHLRGKWSLNLESVVIDKAGNVLQGQHRIVGLILGEQIRQLNTAKWGAKPLQYSTLIGYGASNTAENANTYDLGSKRSLDDVLYRHQKFAKSVDEKTQKKISKILATAIRIVWIRAGGKQVSFAPHFPHSEALEFYKTHPEILKAVEEIVEIDDGEGGERRISDLVSLGYAAALHYLMNSVGKSLGFWKSVASGEGLEKGDVVLSLRQYLVRADGGGSKRDEIIGTIIKAWLLWSKGKGGLLKQIRIAKRKEGDRFILSECPRIGGIDSVVENEVELTQQQRVILVALKKAKEEITYKDLQEATGLTAGSLGKLLMPKTKDGEPIPHSLGSRGLVSVNQYAPEEGEKIAPFYFQLTKKGKAA